ncbi:MAG: hypothetical protein H6619_06765 [Deltaproteobacteria bacterium]|nr:hypothetical protein [Deltaproteobacteria bacterium]
MKQLFLFTLLCLVPIQVYADIEYGESFSKAAVAASQSAQPDWNLLKAEADQSATDYCLDEEAPEGRKICESDPVDAPTSPNSRKCYKHDIRHSPKVLGCTYQCKFYSEDDVCPETNELESSSILADLF